MENQGPQGEVVVEGLHQGEEEEEEFHQGEEEGVEE